MRFNLRLLALAVLCLLAIQQVHARRRADVSVRLRAEDRRGCTGSKCVRADPETYPNMVVYNAHPATVVNPSLWLRNGANVKGEKTFLKNTAAQDKAKLAVSKFTVSGIDEDSFSDYYHCEEGHAWKRIQGQYPQTQTDVANSVTRIGIKSVENGVKIHAGAWKDPKRGVQALYTSCNNNQEACWYAFPKTQAKFTITVVETVPVANFEAANP